MKNKFLKSVFVIAIAMIAGINVYNAQKTVVLSDVAMANVEALADYEVGKGNWIVTIYTTDHWKCDPDGGVYCPGTPW